MIGKFRLQRIAFTPRRQRPVFEKALQEAPGLLLDELRYLVDRDILRGPWRAEAVARRIEQMLRRPRRGGNGDGNPHGKPFTAEHAENAENGKDGAKRP